MQGLTVFLRWAVKIYLVDSNLITSVRQKSTVLYGGRKARLSINIVIVGCGLGGLAAAHALAKAGHKVTILEDAPAIGEVGAGIQVSPNVSKLLIRWGLDEPLKKIAVLPEGIEFRRCKLIFFLTNGIVHTSLP